MTNTYDDSIVIDGLNVSNWDSDRPLRGYTPVGSLRSMPR